MNDSVTNANMDKRHELSGFTLEKTVKLMKLSLSRIMSQHPELDLTVDQWVILHMLKSHMSLSQQELGQLTFKDAPTVTRMIDLLVAKKLVKRIQDAQDRRKYNLKLTELGIQKYAVIEPVVKEFRAEAYEGISSEELKMLNKILNKIFVNLSQES